MADTKFTPGPWRATLNKKFNWWSVCHSGWCDKGDTSVVVRVEDYQDEPQKTANAHLVAAAPEMYAVLADFIKFDLISNSRVQKILRKARGELDE